MDSLKKRSWWWVEENKYNQKDVNEHQQMYDAEIQGPIHNCLILWQLQIIKNRDNIDHNRMKCHLLCKQIPLISFWWRLFIQIRVCEWRLWLSFWQTTCFIVTIRVWNSVFLNTVMTKIYIHTHIYIWGQDVHTSWSRYFMFWKVHKSKFVSKNGCLCFKICMKRTMWAVIRDILQNSMQITISSTGNARYFD
jgi:hypothetical protein